VVRQDTVLADEFGARLAEKVGQVVVVHFAGLVIKINPLLEDLHGVVVFIQLPFLMNSQAPVAKILIAFGAVHCGWTSGVFVRTQFAHG